MIKNSQLTTFRDKYLNHPMQMVRVVGFGENRKLVRYFYTDIHDLMVAASNLAVAGINLETACEDNKNTHILRKLGSILADVFTYSSSA